MSRNTWLTPRRHSRVIDVGGVRIGGIHPVAVQSMTNTDTRDTTATLEQIRRAAAAGAVLMRVSVPDLAGAESLKTIVSESPVPIVADIHFDYRLALLSLDAGVHKLRINPGNIGSHDRVKKILDRARERGVPIRVGVNSGSLEKHILKKYGEPCAEALAESAINNAQWLLDAGFDDVILSLKGSDVPMTVRAYRIVSDASDLPLHIGITEAGTLLTGAVRSAVGLGLMLAEGIGDTLRVSLAADPVEEIRVAYRILESLGIQKRGPTILACPTCSRTRIDIIGLANRVEDALKDRTAPLTVAVMGCIVNGPGEARDADIGIAGGEGEAILFRKGEAVARVKEDELFPRLLSLFDEVARAIGK